MTLLLVSITYLSSPLVSSPLLVSIPVLATSLLHVSNTFRWKAVRVAGGAGVSFI